MTDGLGEDRWWLVPESTVRTVDIVGMAPVGIENLGVQDAVEDLSGEELISSPAVEAFDVGVLPGRAGVDEGGLGASLPKL